MVMRIEEKKKKYNSIVSDVNNALAGLVNKTEKEIDEAKDLLHRAKMKEIKREALRNMNDFKMSLY